MVRGWRPSNSLTSCVGRHHPRPKGALFQTRKPSKGLTAPPEGLSAFVANAKGDAPCTGPCCGIPACSPCCCVSTRMWPPRSGWPAVWRAAACCIAPATPASRGEVPRDSGPSTDGGRASAAQSTVAGGGRRRRRYGSWAAKCSSASGCCCCTVPREGPTPQRLSRLEAVFAVSRRTLLRWRRWWREVVPRSRFWQARRGDWASPVAPESLPISLLAGFSHLTTASEQVLAALRWLAPLAAGADLSEHGK